MNCHHIVEEELKYHGVWNLTNKLILIQKTVQHSKLLSQVNTSGVPGSWLTVTIPLVQLHTT